MADKSSKVIIHCLRFASVYLARDDKRNELTKKEQVDRIALDRNFIRVLSNGYVKTFF